MESYFDVNVSLNGSHLFATHPRSAKTQVEADKIITLFREKFPECEGYEVSCLHWQCQGQDYDPKEVEDDNIIK